MAEAVIIGRDAGVATFVLDHSTVSRRHARFWNDDGRFSIEDLGSTNGTFVNGTRCSGATPLTASDVLEIGPFRLALDRGTLRVENAASLPLLQGHLLAVEVQAGGQRRRILDDVSLQVRRGEFVALLGPSGCGKSTLLRLLAGRSNPTSGWVQHGAWDLASHFDRLKQQIAFVSQRETIPDDLELEQALEFTARLRLPSDSRPEDVAAAVERALVRVGLIRQRTQCIRLLSGGQRKRAALANELIADPTLVFLDEVTSGLDEATDREMMQLFRELARQGTTVVCVTHTVANVQACCDRIVVMATGGRIAYDGPPSTATSWFGVTSLGDVYECASGTAAGSFVNRHGESRHADALLRPARDVISRSGRRGEQRRWLSQLPVLLQRNVAVAAATPSTLAIALAQAFCIGALLRLVFGSGSLDQVQSLQFAFLLGVSSFWFGCSNGSKEIVKERPLFELERAINLRIPSYVVSKLLVLATIGVAQVLLLHGVVAVAGVSVVHVRQLLPVHLLLGIVGGALGLMISAYSQREEQAAVLVPIALIPQILLSGAVVSTLSASAEWTARVGVSAYWMYRAQRAIVSSAAAEASRPLTMLLVHFVAYTLVAGLLLRRADRRR